MSKKDKVKKKEKSKKCPHYGIHLFKKLEFCFNCDWIFRPKKKVLKKKNNP